MKAKTFETALEWWPKLHAFAYQLTRDRARSEDLCQEAFFRLWRLERDFDSGRSALPYLLATVRNLVRSEARRRPVEALDERGPAELASEDADPRELAERDERCRLVHDALAEMNPTWRAALYLADGLDLSYGEIAEALGKSEDVVRTTLHRARLRVRVALRSRIRARSAEDAIIDERIEP